MHVKRAKLNCTNQKPPQRGCAVPTAVPQEDIVFKLPVPIAVGDSARRSSKLRLNFDFNKVDLA